MKIVDLMQTSINVRNLMRTGTAPDIITVGTEKINRVQYIHAVCEAISYASNPKLSYDEVKSLDILGVPASVDLSAVTQKVNDGNIPIDEIIITSHALKNFIQGNKRNPTLHTTSLGTLTVNNSMYLYSRCLAYYAENQAFPTQAAIDNAYDLTPVQVTPPANQEGWSLTGIFTQDYQDTSYTCGPSSAQMVFSALGYSFSESQIATLAGTTTNGTSHNQLYNAMKSLVPGLQINEYYLSDIGFDGIASKLNNDSEVILHIQTGPLKTDADGNSVWQNNYGHYIFLVGVNTGKGRVRVADPTKGVKEFTFAQITSAINAVSGQKSVMVFHRP